MAPNATLNQSCAHESDYRHGGLRASVDIYKNKTSEGIFSSDGGNSPAGRNLQPHYAPISSRP